MGSTDLHIIDARVMDCKRSSDINPSLRCTSTGTRLHNTLHMNARSYCFGRFIGREAMLPYAHLCIPSHTCASLCTIVQSCASSRRLVGEESLAASLAGKACDDMHPCQSLSCTCPWPCPSSSPSPLRTATKVIRIVGAPTQHSRCQVTASGGPRNLP